MTARAFLLVGLTGGIATGKSTVAALFRRLGAVVIDADDLAREVVVPGEPAYRDIVAAFGPGVLAPDGTLDRKALGALVFADPEKRRRLEALTHPRIRERLAARLAALAAAGFQGLVVFDAALMVESGTAKTMDRLVVVATDEATQVERLIARDGIDGEEALRKIRSQMPVAEKAKLADYVIDNRGDPTAAASWVRRVYDGLRTEVDVSAALMSHGSYRRVAPLGVVFPVNMGNRGHNEVPPATILAQLRRTSTGVEFLGYHWRKSGNFLFVDAGAGVRAHAVEAVSTVTGLPCVGRSFPELVQLFWHVPDGVVTTSNGSLILNEPGTWRLVVVFLDGPTGERCRLTGRLSPWVRIMSWPSDRDILCAYERPGEVGDVGQVTRAVVRQLSSKCDAPPIIASGRSMGVVRDLLSARGCRKGDNV